MRKQYKYNSHKRSIFDKLEAYTKFFSENKMSL